MISFNAIYSQNQSIVEQKNTVNSKKNIKLIIIKNNFSPNYTTMQNIFKIILDKKDKDGEMTQPVQIIGKMEKQKKQKDESSDESSDQIVSVDQNSKTPPIKSRCFQEILKFAAEVTKEELKNVQKDPKPKDFNENLPGAFHILLDLYIKEEILKHHCNKKGWKFEYKQIEQIVLPVLDVLSIDPTNIQPLFQPFLREISEIYLMYTEVDTYSRFDSSELLLEITKTWAEIKKAEIKLKSLIKSQLKIFKDVFYRVNRNSNDKRPKFNRRKLFLFLFGKMNEEKKRDQIRMLNLLKVFIFCQKALDEDLSNDIEDWVRSK